MENYTTENQIPSDIGCSNVLSKFSTSSVLVKNAKNDNGVGLFATFSGQGVDSYFDELNAMFTLHNDKISNLVTNADQMFRRQLDTPEARKIGIHKQGLHILDWLTGARPSKDYLIQCAISYPLILLVQLCHYIVTARLLFPDSKDPIAEMKKLWKGTTGHSQGIVASVIISVSETEEAFIVNSCKMLKYLFWQGLRLQDNFNEIQSAITQFIPEPNAEIESQLIGKPTPLLAILGLPYDIVKKQVDKVNQLFEGSSLFRPNIEVSLINGPRAIVCSGSPSILPVFVKSLQSIQAKPDEDQSRIPFSKRKQHFRMVFLHVSVPFHSTTFCGRALASIHSDIEANDIRFESKDLTVPVYSTLDGSDLRSSKDLMKEIVELQCVKLVHWEKALEMASKDHGISHIVDFGPGGLMGAVSLTGRLKEGRGVAVIAIGSEIGDTRVFSQDAIFSNEMKVAQNWKDFAPTLVKKAGKLMLNTKFSKLIGKPPIMVAGMTPTTANEELVAAFTNSGYHGELAGGGQATEKIFKERIDNLVNMLQPGQGIHLNVLFLNPKLWNMQFPLSLQMRSQGIPIDSLTVAAGVPSLEKANEILAGIRAVGMKYIAFKPGSVAAIKSVLQIAENNPDITIVIQWTGGRAGGHHSFEDQYEPILETYASIRRLSNTVLIAGGGLGDPEEATELLTGVWSEIHGYPPMPFDGLLLGSRVMVAKEAKTSRDVKKLIVDTTGVSHQEWERSYEDDAGGVITVISELGEPIHKIATRGVMVWRDFDRKFFGLPAAQQEKAILSQKSYIIEKLNKDFQKVYFGKKLDGSVADVDRMTYFEVLVRMSELMYAKKQWIHGSYRERFVVFAQRTEERFGSRDSIIDDQTITSDPSHFLRIFQEKYPESNRQLLTAEDVDYFLYLCRERGKPVNFVPIIDKDLQFWFKKDSLWQSEHVEFVQDEDVGRVCILQGPVAVKYSTKVDEPVGDILENLNQDIIKRLAVNAQVSEVEYLDTVGDVTVTNVAMDTQVKDGTKEITYTLGTDLPKENDWFEFLAGKNVSWWRALLTSFQFSDGKFRVDNGVKSLFKPRPGHKYVLRYSQDVPTLITVLNSVGQTVAEVKENSKKITVIVYHIVKDKHIPLQLEYVFQPETGNQALIKTCNNNNSIKEFYTKLWFSSPFEISTFNLNSTFESTKTIKKEEIEIFSNSIAGSKPTFNIKTGKLVAPIDYTIVACWESMMKPLFPWALDANLMSLLHLSYSYKIVHPNPNFLLCEGDTIVSNVTIKEIVNMPSGKRVTVMGMLKHENVNAIEVTSQFFFPGNFQDFSTNFQRKEVTRVVYVQDKKTKAILTSKPWIQWSSEPQIGDKILLKIQCYHEYKSEKQLKNLATTGQVSVYRGTMLEAIGTIQFEDKDNLYTQDPIESFLERHGKPADEVTIFENGGNIVEIPDDEPIYAPSENVSYSNASGDHNPIHSNIYIADLAGLPATITHGMWSAALARNLIDKFVTKKPYSYKVKNFQATFMEKVKPNDCLFAKITHVGMKNGLRIIQVEILNENEIVVLKSLAEVEQPKPAYVFTGQGSAEIGMGMDLYKQSQVAKEIWDRAEKHMLENYGFSLMTIVNKNPKELTVGFGGPRGSSIREKYMRLKHDLHVIENGVTVKKIVPLFPEISENTDFYTFRHPQGLLYATQFTQPALTLLEKASFADMKEKGLVPSDRFFAGHSLGEYAALASVANVLSVEALVELVFIRGITMQNAVPRDEQGRSCFSMVAVNPQRVGVFFSSGDLASLCNVISQKSGKLLQIVNFNVDNWQYIVTGHNANLEALRIVLTVLKENPTKKQEMDRVIEDAMSQFPASAPLYTISQGPATMPLTGVDVPFHSDMLLGEVPRFREYLLKTLDHKTLDIGLLENKYIPNLTAIPFQASLDYAEIICKTMENSVLPGILSSRKFNMEIQDEKQQLAYWILVELLAFQFASPVKWIETQDYFFKNGVEMLVEIGPIATLKGMAARTLQLNTKRYNSLVPRQLLSFKSDRDIIYYEAEPGNEAKNRVPKWLLQRRVQEVPAAIEVAVPQVSAPVPVKAAQPTPVTSKPVGDRPVSAFETLQILLALKLKKSITEITGDSTIKDLVGGKSAIQNEILGDLQKEFGTEPDSAATTPLSQLSQVMGASYTKLGSQSQKLVSRVVSAKMPAGFGLSEIQDHLHKERELGPGLTESVMLHSVIMEPEARLESITKSREWLDSVADAYASARGVSIGYKSNASGSVNVTVNAVDSEVLKQYERKHAELYRDNMSLLAGFLGIDLRSGDRQAEAAGQLRQTVEKELDVWEKEHGKIYADGIKPMFDSLKARKFNSSWNWARQEAFSLFYDTLAENPAQFDSNYCKRVFSLTNRATPELVDLVMELAKKAYSEGNTRVGKHVENLSHQIKNHLDAPPLFRILSSTHEMPTIEVKNDGKIIYKEVPRTGVKTFEEFVKEMRKGFLSNKSHKKKRNPLFQKKNNRSLNMKRLPYLSLRNGKPEDVTDYDPAVTNLYYSSLTKLAPEGLSFQHKTVLVTGAGRGSIGVEILKGLLAGGANVVVTTSRYGYQVTEMYKNIYEEWGSKDSQLIVLPFNQGSQNDVNAIIDYIYNELDTDIDFVLPFAAISEGGRDVSNLDSLSELSHRVMLTNVLRMIGKIKSVKQSKGIDTNPACVILPLSPNHGVFGGDGLYAESKLGLETIFNKWESESWQNYISIIGAVIGWTRGTGLMEGNNMVAHGVEQLGMRTFSQTEMAYAILGLLSAEIITASQQKPLWADLTGGMLVFENLKSVVSELRSQISEKSEIFRSVSKDTSLDDSCRISTQRHASTPSVSPRSNINLRFPDLPTQSKLSELRHLRGMVDLDKTVVIIGMGEVGPWGNQRTRWDIESRGELSIEGCVELAWIMGLVKYHNGPLKDGTKYVGWVDAKTMSPIKDMDIKMIYEDTILTHSGIRVIEPELFDGYDPHKKQFLHEVVLHHDLDPFEVVTQEDANQFKLEHGDKVDVFEREGKFLVQFKRGASMFLPRALKFDRFVAGQVPTGWDPARYGIPADIINQVDKITLYNLVSTVEAFVSAGIIDPYEFYEYVHVSEIGNCAGGGIGGLNAIRKTYRERFLEKPVQADILQEVFINVMPAWVNLLLLSSSGPIKTPVGACATAAESVEIGADCILSGKAQIVIVGGYDDFGEESSYEFAQMKATSNSETEIKMGRTPKEMSRPVSDTRAGFMESQGAGTQVICSASMAIRMGVPIYGIIALTNTASDKVGRSVPAPGRGLLTTARESKMSSPLLDIKYRKRQLEAELELIKKWKETELSSLKPEYHDFVQEQAKRKEKAALSLWGNNFYQGNDGIAPLRGALAVWGLSMDDLGVASFHGTGTKANDFNESQVTQLQLEHLGRTPGNAIFTIFQKYLTGHPKGAAAAWMANGLVQSLLSGIIPGNKNADNVDIKLKSFDHLVYTSKPIKTTGLKAGLLKSFGFGQASAEVVIIHPDYLFAVINDADFERYAKLRKAREERMYRFQLDVFAGKAKFVNVKENPPYDPEDEADVYLDPKSRAKFDPKINSWKFGPRKTLSKKEEKIATAVSVVDSPIPKPRYECPAPKVTAAKSLEVTMLEMSQGLRQSSERGGIGIDVQLISEINSEDADFVSRNFTDSEIEYCKSAGSKDAIKNRFAGRWAAKEAVIKAISNCVKDTEKTAPVWKGGAAALKGIEILPTGHGPASVKLYEHAAEMARVLGVNQVKVTISHSGEYAVAHAIAQ